MKIWIRSQDSQNFTQIKSISFDFDLNEINGVRPDGKTVFLGAYCDRCFMRVNNALVREIRKAISKNRDAFFDMPENFY
jgi:hypothetical protein